MSYATVGACATCGAPIYAESPWYGTCPPPSHHSCGCHGGYRMVSTGTDTVVPIPSPYTQQQPPGFIPAPKMDDSSKEVIDDLVNMLESEDLLEVSEVDELKSEMASLSDEVKALTKIVVDFINHTTEEEEKKVIPRTSQAGEILTD